MMKQGNNRQRATAGFLAAVLSLALVSELLLVGLVPASAGEPEGLQPAPAEQVEDAAQAEAADQTSQGNPTTPPPVTRIR